MKSIGLNDIYYGWKNLFGSFLCAAVAIGFTTYIYGMFTVPVTEELGISRATYNNGMIAFMAGMAVMSPIVGHFLDRCSARRLLLLGGLVFGASLMFLSRLHSPGLMLAVILIPVTFGVAACGILGANTITVRWFMKRRGRALGILALSTSVGGFVVQPLGAFLIESFGWRNALFILGCIALLIFTAMAALVVRDRPKGTEAGYENEFPTATGGDRAAQGQEEKVWGKRELFRSRNFWLLATCIGIMFGIDQAVLVSQVPYFQDIGFDLTMAAILVSVKTFSAIAGKLAIGYLADKVDLRYLFVYVAGCNALLMVIYMLQPGFWVLVVAVGLLGVAVGGVFPVWTTLMAWLFGPRSYGTVMGFMSIIMQPFAVITLRFVGEVHDRTGSYVPGFGIFMVLALTSGILVWFLKPESSVVRTDGAGKLPVNGQRRGPVSG